MQARVEIFAGKNGEIIEGLTGRTVTLDVARNATVGDMRKQLAEAIGLSDINCIQFIVNGDPIDDSVLASTYHFFQKETRLHASLLNLPSSFFDNEKLKKIQANYRKEKKEREEENECELEKNRRDLTEAQAKVKALQTSLDEKTKSGKELLFQAIHSNDIELFNVAFEKFSNKSEILSLKLIEKNHHNDTLSLTPLFKAASIGSIEIVKKLLEIPGINIDEKVLTMNFIPAVCPEVRQTPLGIAIQKDNRPMVKLLLSKGANPDCFYWSSPNMFVTDVVNMYKYRIEIEKELHSWWYENITIPVKKHCAFFKDHFPHDKAVKLEMANLIIDVLEGKKDASVYRSLTEKQKLAIRDGRLKEVFENISDEAESGSKDGLHMKN